MGKHSHQFVETSEQETAGICQVKHSVMEQWETSIQRNMMDFLSAIFNFLSIYLSWLGDVN